MTLKTFKTLSICALFLLILFIPNTVFGQERITSTPVRVNIPTRSPEENLAATATPTRTPSPQGPVLLQAKETAGEINVRAEPDINADNIIGSIRFGDQYVVLGKYYRWYQFQFDTSPNGRGWVFDELVDILGDEALIPSLESDEEPTVDSSTEVVVQTQSVVTLTPGGILTATAEARVIDVNGVGGDDTVASSNIADDVVFPTFTYPPELTPLAVGNQVSQTATPIPGSDSASSSTENKLPPITPIVILGGIGLFGLFLSIIRR